MAFHDHRRAAKRRALEIGSRRGAARRAKTYRRLLRLAANTLGYVEAALPAVAAADAPWARSWTKAAAEYGDLLGRVAEQTTRRVFDGETVPAAEKVVSLFEPHTGIIRKGGRRTHYGHKVNLATGRGAVARRVRRRLRIARQPRAGQGAGRGACRVPQEGRPEGNGHVALVVAARPAQALPRRHRSRHLLSQALLRPGPMPLPSGLRVRASRWIAHRDGLPLTRLGAEYLVKALEFSMSAGWGRLPLGVGSRYVHAWAAPYAAAAAVAGWRLFDSGSQDLRAVFSVGRGGGALSPRMERAGLAWRTTSEDWSCSAYAGHSQVKAWVEIPGHRAADRGRAPARSSGWEGLLTFERRL